MNAASPSSLAEAVAILAAGPRLLIAGGTDLMVRPLLDRLDAGPVMDLQRIPELTGIREVDGAIEIGAATTFAEIGRSSLVAERLPALGAAARVVGGWQIQNRATLGGNAANASPAGDSLPVLLVLDAALVCAGPAGEREISCDAFHLGYRRTALAADELIVRFRFPLPPPGTVQAFRKVGTREAQAIAKVVAAMLAQVEEGRLVALRLAAGSVAATPVRLPRTEEALAGRPLDATAVELARRTAAAEVTPIDDVRSTAEYRRWALGNVVARMISDLLPDPAKEAAGT